MAVILAVAIAEPDLSRIKYPVRDRSLSVAVVDVLVVAEEDALAAMVAEVVAAVAVMVRTDGSHNNIGVFQVHLRIFLLLLVLTATTEVVAVP